MLFVRRRLEPALSSLNRAEVVLKTNSLPITITKAKLRCAIPNSL